MTLAGRLTAMRAGRLAGLARKPVTACPYATDGPPEERAYALAWLREWRAASPARPVSYEG